MASAKQVVGNPTTRVEGELKVSGKAVYAADVTLPGMLWGKLVRSPIASGKIKRIDASKALGLRGVHAVVTGEDCTGLKIGRRLYDMPILADGEVRFIGEKGGGGFHSSGRGELQGATQAAQRTQQRFYLYYLGQGRHRERVSPGGYHRGEHLYDLSGASKLYRASLLRRQGGCGRLGGVLVMQQSPLRSARAGGQRAENSPGEIRFQPGVHRRRFRR